MRNVTRFIGSPYYSKEKRSRGMLHFESTKTSFSFPTKRWSFNLLSLLDSSLRSVAIATIGGYQRHLSPRKGYSCSHRIVYGGASCSEYVKQTLADKSLFETTLLSRQRFRECNIAHISSKNRVVASNGSVMVSAGFDGDCITGIVSIIGAILALILGKNSGCCK
jgi:putative component of membrane protein insertase Oxa1/YidC/SpoIIIJ protein YidD